VHHCKLFFQPTDSPNFFLQVSQHAHGIILMNSYVDGISHSLMVLA
jgi:hypothetical protein